MISRIALRSFFGMVPGLILVLLFGAPTRVVGGGTVTNLSNPTNLLQALRGGGTVTFAADGTVTLTRQITISQNTILDGAGHTVTIAGPAGTNASGRIFNVKSGRRLTLLGITLANGRSSIGGAILNRGALTLSNCTLRGNSAIGTNGADGVHAPTNSVFAEDGGRGRHGGAGLGGAIFNIGRATLVECTLSDNSATGGDGGDGGNGGTPAGGFRGGDAGRGGNGGAGLGGAIYNGHKLFVSDSTFDGNTVTGGDAGESGEPGQGPSPGLKVSGGVGGLAAGGAIYNIYRADIFRSTLVDNSGEGGNSAGGGREENGDGEDGRNGAKALGGAFCNVASARLVNSTLVRNRVTGGDGGQGGDGGFFGGDGGNGGDGMGGAIYNARGLRIRNCTVFGGSAFGGAGATNGLGSVPGDEGKEGEGLGGNIAGFAGQVALVNSIVAGAATGGNGHGRIADFGGNISSDDTIRLFSDFGSSMRTDPRLESLDDNGGPTRTMALRPSSPAIDFGFAEDCPRIDQRLVVRVGDSCDSGAYELVFATISGEVTDQDGAGLEGVTISADGIETQTDLRGEYTLSLVTGTYTVTASMEGLSFTPPSYTINLVGDTNGVDFTAVPALAVSGFVRETNGVGLPNVEVTAGTNESAFTDEDGFYQLIFETNTTVTIRPELEGFTFTPTQTVVVVTSNIANVNFTASTNEPPAEMSAASGVELTGARLAVAAIPEAGIIEISATGATPGAYILEISTNLADWAPLQAGNISTQSVLRFRDAISPDHGIRFYRIRKE